MNADKPWRLEVGKRAISYVLAIGGCAIAATK